MTVTEPPPSTTDEGPRRVASTGSLDRPLAPGTRVEVRTQFERTWVRGFEVVTGHEDGYRIRRLSDGRELPTLLARDDVRRERRRSQWWY